MLCLISVGTIQQHVDNPLQSVIGSEKRYILIDAGHGGEDGGAVAPDGTLEKDINLPIATTLANILRMSGFTIKMTRDGDYSIYDAGSSSVRQKKSSDLKNRLQLVNQSYMTISIHQNKFEQSKYYGTQIFYSTNHPESKLMATTVRQTVLDMLQPENTRQLKVGNSDIYLLHKASVPIILVECGFMSNPSELAKLKDKQYQKQMAYAIACGILAYGP